MNPLANYSRNSQPDNLPPFLSSTQIQSASVSCPPGQFVLGGGEERLDLAAQDMRTVSSFPLTINEWTVSWVCPSGGDCLAVDSNVNVWVTCADAP